MVDVFPMSQPTPIASPEDNNIPHIPSAPDHLAMMTTTPTPVLPPPPTTISKLTLLLPVNPVEYIHTINKKKITPNFKTNVLYYIKSY